MKNAIALAGLASVLATTAPVPTIQIDGAGATLPHPIYSKWFSEYNKLHPEVQIKYQPVGSGDGIRQLTDKTVFFAASDGPLTDEQLKAAPGKVLHFPTVLGALVPVYNIPGVSVLGLELQRGALGTSVTRR
jgi:phosphate transport system substrate-binding protein